MLIRLRSLEDSDKETAAPAPKIVPKKPANKWQGEDEEEDGPVVSSMISVLNFVVINRGIE